MYTANTNLMLDLREKLRQRAVLTSQDVQSELAHNARGYYLRQVALSDPSFALVNFTVPFEQPLTARAADRSRKSTRRLAKGRPIKQ
jgi:hypothetical protein